MKKIYIAGCGGMLGEAFNDVFSKSYDLKCSDIDINEMSFAPGILREIFSKNWIRENSLSDN